MFLRFFSLNLIYCRLFGNCCNNEQEGEGGGTGRQIYNWLSDLEQAIQSLPNEEDAEPTRSKDSILDNL